jgi:hypothetical protein
MKKGVELRWRRLVMIDAVEPNTKKIHYRECNLTDGCRTSYLEAIMTYYILGSTLSIVVCILTRF